VESYVAHIRTLLEERECLTAEYERDNEDLRHELHQIKHQQESVEEAVWPAQVCSEQTQYDPCRFPLYSSF
ncbi:hypothetical protein XENOCAPTIV_030430, partial [Xenoophorus captivus]